MKKIAIFTALSMFAGIASAQSSVTLYGIADAALRYTSNSGGSSRLQITQGTPNTVGLQGSEDLGGGSFAIFKLDSGYLMATGGSAAPGVLFNRQSYVGIRTANWGTVTLGRQYDFIDIYLQPLTAEGQRWAGGTVGGHFGDVDNLGDTYWLNNSIKYAAHPWSGLDIGGMVSFGGQAGQFSQNAAYSAGFTYTHGPITLAGAYDYVDNPVTSVYGGNTSGGFVPGPYTGLQNAKKLKIGVLGGTYQITRQFVMNVVYSNTTLTDSQLAKGNAKYQIIEVNGHYDLTPFLLIGAGYTYTSGTWSASDSHPRFHQINLGTQYALSKRTYLYVKGAFERAAGDAQFAQIGAGAIAASSGKSQFAVDLGIRHYF